MCLVTQNGTEVCLCKVTSFLPEGHGLLASLLLISSCMDGQLQGSQNLQLLSESVAESMESVWKIRGWVTRKWDKTSLGL